MGGGIVVVRLLVLWVFRRKPACWQRRHRTGGSGGGRAGVGRRTYIEVLGVTPFVVIVEGVIKGSIISRHAAWQSDSVPLFATAFLDETIRHDLEPVGHANVKLRHHGSDDNQAAARTNPLEENY